jgi:hypothetical protein
MTPYFKTMKTNIFKISLLSIAYCFYQLTLLLIIALTILNTLLNNPFTMSLILSNILDKEIAIEKVNTSIDKHSRCIKVNIEGFNISNRNIVEYSEIMQAESVEAHITMKSLLSNTIIIDKLLLKNADIYYFAFTNGSNFTGTISNEINGDYSFIKLDINQIQLDSSCINYYYYNAAYDKKKITLQPTDSAIIQIDKSSFVSKMAFNGCESVYSDNICDEYNIEFDSFSGRINTLTINNKGIIDNMYLNYEKLFLKYIYDITSMQNTILFRCDGTINIDNTKLNRTDFFADYDSTNYKGFLTSDIDLKLNSQNITHLAEFAKFELDSLFEYENILFEGDTRFKFNRFSIDWDYNSSKNSEKLIFDTGISIKGISLCTLFKEKDVKLNIDCNLNYDYKSTNGKQNQKIEISNLEVNGLDSKLFTNQNIVIINDSLKVFDFGLDVSHYLINNFLRLDEIDLLTGRLLIPSVKVTDLITSKNINLATIINELEILEALVYDANIYIKDFCHPIKDIVVFASFKDSCLIINNADFQIGEAEIRLNGKLLNPADFFFGNDEVIKLYCEIYLPNADINTLTSCYSKQIDSDSIKYNFRIPEHIDAEIKIVCDTLKYIYDYKYEHKNQVIVKQRKKNSTNSFEIYIDEHTNNSSDTLHLDLRSFFVSLLIKSGQLNYDRFEFYLGDAFIKSKGIINNDNNLTLNAKFEVNNLNTDNILDAFKPYFKCKGIKYPSAHICKIEAKCNYQNILCEEKSLCTLSDVYIAIDSANISYPNTLLKNDTLFVKDTTLLFKIIGKSFYDSTIFERDQNKFGCYQIDYNTKHSFELINHITSDFYKNLFLLYHIKTELDTLLTFYDNSKLSFNDNNTKPLREFLYCDNSSGQLFLPIKTQINKNKDISKTTKHFELCLDNIDLEVAVLNILSSKYDESIDSILKINDIELQASLNRDSIRINHLSFHTLDGTIIGKDILAHIQSQERIQFSVEKFDTDSIKFYDILNTLDKTKISIGDELRNHLNCFNNFSVNFSSHIEETDFFIDDFSSFQNVIDAAIFSAEINANNVNYDKSFSVNIKANFDSKKAKKRPKPNSVKQNVELDFDLSSFANKIIGELTATDDDIEYSINTDLGSSKLTAKWLENEELSVNLNGNTRIGDYIVMQTDSSEYYDMIKDIIIESINIDVLPDSTIIDLKVKDFDLILPHKVKMLLGDLKLRDVFSKKPEVKDFELNLTVLDQEEKIIIDSFILEISPKYIMSVTGQYKNSHLEINMLMISPKLTARDYQIKLSYGNQILDVDIVGVGLLGSFINKLVDTYGKQIADQFGETDKYLNNLIKIKRKEFRKDKRKDRRKQRRTKNRDVIKKP